LSTREEGKPGKGLYIISLFIVPEKRGGKGKGKRGKKGRSGVGKREEGRGRNNDYFNTWSFYIKKKKKKRKGDHPTAVRKERGLATFLIFGRLIKEKKKRDGVMGRGSGGTRTVVNLQSLFTLCF